MSRLRSIQCTDSAALEENAASEFTVEVDRVSPADWARLLSRFNDANLYQSWDYARARWGESRLSHMVLLRGGEVAGVAQLILVRVPLLQKGLAYAKWGPLWKLRGRPQSPEVLRALLRALRQVYAVERGLLLRVSPCETDDPQLREAFRHEGFRPNPRAPVLKTAMLDLAYSLPELRAALSRHWRQNLKRAEGNGLHVFADSTNGAADEFFRLYEEMRKRKNGGWIPPIGYFRHVAQWMEDGAKPRIVLCRQNGEPVAGLVVSAMGAQALALFAATGNKGLDCRASYLLQWHAVQWLKEQGVRWYDLGGINEVTHPGTTQFKLGLAGKLGGQFTYLGEFYACEDWGSRLIVSASDLLRGALIKARESLQELRSPARQHFAAGLTAEGAHSPRVEHG